MSTKVERNYLEINSIKDLKTSKFPPDDCYIDFSDPADFQINKFFYKNIGKDHNWVDRLVWTDKQWINYVSDKNGGNGAVRDIVEQIMKIKKTWNNFNSAKID